MDLQFIVVHGEQSNIHYVLAAGNMIKVAERGARLRFETRTAGNEGYICGVAEKGAQDSPLSPPISAPFVLFEPGVYLHFLHQPLSSCLSGRLLPPPALSLLLPLPSLFSSFGFSPRQTRDREKERARDPPDTLDQWR